MEAQDAALKAAEAAKPKLNYNTAGEDKAVAYIAGHALARTVLVF